MNLINGRLLADKIKDGVAKEVFDLCVNPASSQLCSRRPSLAIILVSSRPDSELYVSLKERTAGDVGIDTNLYKFNEDVSEMEILDTINFLNADDTVDGILVQMPLPKSLDTDKIIKTINPDKDVDGFHPENLKKLENKDLIPARASLPNSNSLGWDDGSHAVNLKLATCNLVISPVFQSILSCLKNIKFDLTNKSVAIVAKPGIFTDSLDKLLERLGAKVISIKPNEVGVKTAEADLLITAIGQADLINGDDIKDGAVLIDIGISKNETGKTCGDVDEISVASKASWLTPVPGGIGPMTVAFALKNTLAFYKAKNRKSQIPNIK